MKAFLLISILLFLVSCKTSNGAKNEVTVGHKVSFMTFNVENLFDTKDDKGKNDETFLPKKLKQSKAHKAKCKKIAVFKWRKQCLDLDWSDKAVKRKMQYLSEVIRLTNNGKGPDVLFLQEVENISVLKQWRDNYLSDLGYKNIVLLEGNDVRGIDVAILTKLAVKGDAQLKSIPFKGMEPWRVKDTRGLLEATLILPGGEEMTAMSVHLPAPYHPFKYREQSLNFIDSIIKTKKKGHIMIAAGDFNIPSEEDKKQKLLKRTVQDNWMVSHKVGCQGCLGTTYYPPKKSWSFLDLMLLSNSLNDGKGWELDKKSVAIINMHKEQKTKKGHPKSFNEINGTGVSDHWPIYLEIAR